MCRGARPALGSAARGERAWENRQAGCTRTRVRRVLTGCCPSGEDTWLAALWLDGGLARPLAHLLDSQSSAEWHLRSPKAVAGACLSGNASHSCSAPPFPRPGSWWRRFRKSPDSTISSPLWLPCLCTQPVLSASVPPPDVGLHRASRAGGAAALAGPRRTELGTGVTLGRPCGFGAHLPQFQLCTSHT